MCFYRHQTWPFLSFKMGSEGQIGIFDHFWAIFLLFFGHKFFSNSLIEPIFLCVSPPSNQCASTDTKHDHFYEPKLVQKGKLAFLAIFGPFLDCFWGITFFPIVSLSQFFLYLLKLINMHVETPKMAIVINQNGCKGPNWHFWPFLAILGWCMPHSLLIFGTDYCNHEIFKWFKLKRDLRCGATVRAI